MVVGGLFYNAGNFGIPVSMLAYGEAGGQVQALVVMFVNTSIFFLGYGILAVAKGDGFGAVLGYFKLPMIYALIAAFVVREAGWVHDSGLDHTVWPIWIEWLKKAVGFTAEGMVPIALMTLGAQLAKRPRWPKWKLIGPVMFLKLAAMPVATGAVVWALGLWPWPGAQIVLAASGPTAVNTLLLAIELDGDTETIADCVFWNTIACAVTVTITLMILVNLGGKPPG